MSDKDFELDISRRKVLASTGSVGAAMGLAGCMGNLGGDGGSSDTESDSDTTTLADKITVNSSWSEGEADAFEEVLAYAEEQSGVDVEHNTVTTEREKSGYLMDYSNEVAPADIVILSWLGRIRSDASKGYLSPVGDTWSGDDFAVEPSQVEVDGKVYAAPFKMDLKPGFWYRESFFEEHGLSEPDDYDEFMDLLDTISGIDGVDAPLASGKGWPLSDMTEAWFMRQKNGVELQRGLMSGDVDFTDPRVKDALSELKRLLQDGYFSTMREFGVQYQYFWNNELPLYFMGSWTPAFDAVKDPSDLGVFRLPGAKGMVGSVNWLMVPKFTEKKAAAKSVVEHAVSKEGQMEWVEEGGFISSNLNVPESAYEIEIMATLSELAGEVPLTSDLDDTLGGPFQSAFWSELKGLWSDPGTDVEDIVTTLDKKQDEALEDS